MKLLRIDSSARRSSVSRHLTAEFVQSWRVQHADGEVIERNLATIAIPHITDDWVQAAPLGSGQAHYRAEARLGDIGCPYRRARQADQIVIGAPMYNFAIPAPLKAWIDQIVRVGQTVLFGGTGPKGLLEGKKVYVITSRGGAFRPGTPTERFDYQEPYLRHILAFIGLTDVTFIHAENQKPGPDAEDSRAAAVAQIQQLTAGAPADAVR